MMNTKETSRKKEAAKESWSRVKSVVRCKKVSRKTKGNNFQERVFVRKSTRVRQVNNKRGEDKVMQDPYLDEYKANSLASTVSSLSSPEHKQGHSNVQNKRKNGRRHDDSTDSEYT
jgi:hypothetical protein